MSSNVQVNVDVASVFFWSTQGYDIGFFECFKDIPTSLGVCCCFPCSIAHVAGQVDGKGFNVTACLCPHLYVYKLRKDVQAKYGINESPDASVCGAATCLCCSAVQDIHQLEKNGDAKFLGGANTSSATTSQPAATETPSQ